MKTVPRNWHRSAPGQWAGTDSAGSGQQPMFSGARGRGIPPEERFWTKHSSLHYRGKSSYIYYGICLLLGAWELIIHSLVHN